MTDIIQNKNIQSLISSFFEDPKESEYVQTELTDLIEHYRSAGEELSIRTISAVLKVSNSDINKFREAIKKTKIDWRDILVLAGFENDINEHINWINNTLETKKTTAHNNR